MKKKVLAIILCVVMVFGILPVYAFAKDGSSDWTYNALSEVDKTAEITGYNGTDTELVFPEEIDGFTMVAIADNAFKFKANSNCPIISITIPSTYKRIGNNVFENARNLEEINLPNTLEFIGLNAFSKTSLYFNIMNDLEYNNKPLVFYIGEYLIGTDQHSEFPECYTVTPGTKLIAAGAFSFCYDLKKVIIPDGVEYVNEEAFLWCNSITSVVFPNTVKTISAGSFIASRLSAVVIPKSVEYIDEKAFTENLMNMTIYGTEGTLAEEFANKVGATFIPIQDIVYGDVDSDGSVTITDYSATKSCVVGETEFEGCAEIIGDMNSDCVIDGFDLFQIDKTVNDLN